LQRGERITARLLLARQSAHLPAAVVGALEGKVEATQAQLRECMPRQQAGIQRHQHFGVADGEAFLAFADAQVVQLQQRAAPGPFGLDAIEGDRSTRTLAQPRGDAVGVAVRPSGSSWLATPSSNAIITSTIAPV
jgi:hypothetical protein